MRYQLTAKNLDRIADLPKSRTVWRCDRGHRRTSGRWLCWAKARRIASSGM